MSIYSDDGDVRDIARALRRRKLLVASVLVLFLAIGYGAFKAQDQVYEASAVVSVERPPAPVDGTSPPSLEGDRLVRSQRDFVESDGVRAEVTRRIGEHPRISTSAKESRDVMTITAEDPVAERAAQVANTYATTYLELRQASQAAQLTTAITSLDQRVAQLEAELAAVPGPLPNGADPAGYQRNQVTTQLAEVKQRRSDLQLRANVAAVSVGGQIVDAAETPAAPARPDRVRYLGVALLAGLIVGVAAALVRNSLDRSVRLAGGQLGDVPGLPVLAVVPHVPWWRRLVPGQGGNAVTEAFRSLRAVLASTPPEHPARVVQVVGARRGRRAAETVVAVGSAFEHAGHRTLVVSADFRHARLPGLLGIPREPGLVSLLLGQAAVQDALRPVGGHEHLLALPPGPATAASPDLLASQKLTVVLEQLRSQAEMVFVEAPPVLSAADSLELATDVDGTVLVVASGRTKIDDVQRALSVLAAVGGNVLGCVVYEGPGR